MQKQVCSTSSYVLLLYSNLWFAGEWQINIFAPWWGRHFPSIISTINFSIHSYWTAIWSYQGIMTGLMLSSILKGVAVEFASFYSICCHSLFHILVFPTLTDGMLLHFFRMPTTFLYIPVILSMNSSQWLLLQKIRVFFVLFTTGQPMIRLRIEMHFLM